MSEGQVENLSRARNAVIAASLSWTLDAFDFFILIFTFDDVAKAFGVSVKSITFAITLTLATRALGAFIFGRLADKYGRKPILMLVVLLYSIFEAASGFAWSFASFLVIRAAFGIAMGGEWGIGSSLAMETIPDRWRGWVSGLLQAGYPLGYFLATLLFGFAYAHLGWRGMFFVGASPAILIFFINARVEESPAFQKIKSGKPVSALTVLRKHGKLAIYAIVMMAAFNFFSHGTQDIYPKLYLAKQVGLSHPVLTNVVLLYNLGAMLGGVAFGLLSQKIGRRWAIGLACVLSLIVLYFWSHSATPVIIAAAAFMMQFAVQGAWGVVPVHLNELSPAEIRGTFPGFVYQLGNFIASVNAPMQVALAGATHNYGFALMVTAGTVAVLLIILMIFGPEAKNISMANTAAA
jgi:SHS family lactate transporter-like MFS transporter